MDPLNWKRLLALAAGGVAVGYGAAQIVDATDWHPLVAPLIIIIAVAAIGFSLRRCEFLNFLIEDGAFAYCAYVGMSLVRASGHNFLATQLPFHYAFGLYDGTAFLGGFNIVVALVGLPYAFMMVLLFGVPAWALGQYTRKSESDERFWDFVRQQNRER